MKGLFFFKSVGVPGGSPELGKGNSGWVPSPALYLLRATCVYPAIPIQMNLNDLHHEVL